MFSLERPYGTPFIFFLPLFRAARPMTCRPINPRLYPVGVRVIVNFMHRDGWTLHILAEDCQTALVGSLLVDQG
jgi:hypothetical protein